MGKTIKNMEKRASQLRVEIIMGKYYDGWTLKGMKEELANLEIEISTKKNEK